MKKAVTFVLGCMVAGSVLAATVETKPFQASLTPEIAIYPTDTQIKGVALSIWGENPQQAFALGFVNGSSGNSAGFSLGLLWNYAENYKGVQWAWLANYASGEFVGWQSACVNYAESMKGLQSGFVNYAGSLTGCQLGFVNYAETAKSGVQIGFVNIISQNEWFSNFPNELATGMVFVNWRFE